MKNKKNFKIYLRIEKDNTSIFENISGFSKIFLEEKDVLEISGMNKKQLDLYVFRNPEIIKAKKGKYRFISSNILNHVLKSIKMKKLKKDKTNN